MVELPEGLGSQTTLEVVNALGQIIYSSSDFASSPTKQEINLSLKECGIYFIVITTPDKFCRKKVVVAR